MNNPNPHRPDEQSESPKLGPHSLNPDALAGMEDLASELLGVTLVEDTPPQQPEHTPDPRSREILEKNLAFIALRDPKLAKQIRQAPPLTGLTLETAPDGGLTGRITNAGGKRSLASARRPIEEGQRLADSVDLDDAAVVVVRGFALGHHVAALAKRNKGAGSIIVFEPDVALIRAALERHDFTETFSAGDVRLIADEHDEAQLSALLTGIEGLVSMGVRILDHPPSAPRLGKKRDDFGVTLARVISAIRTHVVTTLMQSGVTIRNELMNLDHYAAEGGIMHLKDAAKGRHAVVVSAGPSFKKNAHLLARPGVRDRVVIVAVQTTLKPLLDMGVRPHFVTALDYHEISTRFYEGLTTADVEGVTLVAEPKANPAILEAFPGRVLCPQSDLLDTLLGPELLQELGGDRGRLKRGATVAHLAYYLARFLGCDPVALIGQDLAFTDGQYYAAGAAIHRVWAPELNEFNTLETMEWQRIVRMRRHLHQRTDTLGRPVYSDEQMVTYLLQFERDFEHDKQLGLRTIDATEGGIEKRATSVRSLASVIDDAMIRDPIDLPPHPEPVDSDRRLVRKVRDVRAGVWKLAQLSRKSGDLLDEMIEHREDTARVNQLIDKVHEHRARVRELEPALELVQTLNQTGTLKRAKADRAIYLEKRRLEDDTSLTKRDRELAEQRARMERDATNVRWLADAADEMGDLLDAAARAMRGQPKLTRDPAGRVSDDGEKLDPVDLATWAVIPTDPGTNAMGLPRDLGQPVAGDKHALAITLNRLARTTHLAGAAILTPQPDRVRALLAGKDRLPRAGAPPFEIRILETDDEAFKSRQRSIATARAFAPACWRGGLAGWTVWDELYHAAAVASAVDQLEADAVALVGPDWCLIDPEITDDCIERIRENPDKHRLAFSQAACGLSPCIMSASLARELGAKCDDAGTWGSIGALLGYTPPAPAPDPIGRELCIHVDPAVRDAGERFIADSPQRRDRLELLLADAGIGASAETIARAAKQVQPPITTGEIIVEAIDHAGVHLTPDQLATAIGQIAAGQPLAVTITGDRDPAAHPRLAELIAAARTAGAHRVHVRTQLSHDATDALLSADVVSCDLVALTSETYKAITGRDEFQATRERFGALANRRDTDATIPTPWLVPRLTRRDEVYEQIETFYDEALTACGCAVIDPLPTPIDGARIAPLPLPGTAEIRRSAETARVLATGEIVRDTPTNKPTRTEAA